MKNNIILILSFLTITISISCDKKIEKQNTTQTLIPFEKIPFEIDVTDNELEFINNETIILYSSTDTINSQIKQIENSPNRRIYKIDELENFYQIKYFEYGEKPQSFIAYVNKKYFENKDPYALDLLDINEIRYSEVDGFYDDKNKSFTKYGNVKLVTENFYKSQKDKVPSKFISATTEVITNNETKSFNFKTNSDEIVTIPFSEINQETNEKTVFNLVGFSSILQRYVFKASVDNQNHYVYYSKRRNDIKPLQTINLPIYNSINKKFIELYNDSDVGCNLVLYKLDQDFNLKTTLFVNFTNFIINDDSVYWISKDAFIAKVQHPNQKDQDKFYYILIQLSL